ncbi:hypothetical protein, partial [Moorena sp. SIO3H5]|uniref:hypothetical protein n=1 Tax=Moorena sp. SIO3H5 TaxID=2607834 RepID=UPI0013B9A01C
RKQATGNRQRATGNRQQETGNKQQATGNRQQATGNRQQATGKKKESRFTDSLDHQGASYISNIPEQMRGVTPHRKNQPNGLVCNVVLL